MTSAINSNTLKIENFEPYTLKEIENLLDELKFLYPDYYSFDKIY
jgi:hypothetical protein